MCKVKPWAFKRGKTTKRSGLWTSCFEELFYACSIVVVVFCMLNKLVHISREVFLDIKFCEKLHCTNKEKVLGHVTSQRISC